MSRDSKVTIAYLFPILIIVATTMIEQHRGATIEGILHSLFYLITIGIFYLEHAIRNR